MAAEWTPADVNELVRAIFFGVATVCVPLATVYTIISAARAKRSIEASEKNAKSIEAVSANVVQLEKNTNSISERNEAIAKALGVTEGMAMGARVAPVAPAAQGVQGPAGPAGPVGPVGPSAGAATLAAALAPSTLTLPMVQAPLPVVDKETAEKLDKVVDKLDELKESKEPSNGRR